MCFPNQDIIKIIKIRIIRIIKVIKILLRYYLRIIDMEGKDGSKYVIHDKLLSSPHIFCRVNQSHGEIDTVLNYSSHIVLSVLLNPQSPAY